MCIGQSLLPTGVRALLPVFCCRLAAQISPIRRALGAVRMACLYPEPQGPVDLGRCVEGFNDKKPDQFVQVVVVKVSEGQEASIDESAKDKISKKRDRLSVTQNLHRNSFSVVK
jgi:hypothetical protein